MNRAFPNDTASCAECLAIRYCLLIPQLEHYTSIATTNRLPFGGRELHCKQDRQVNFFFRPLDTHGPIPSMNKIAPSRPNVTAQHCHGSTPTPSKNHGVHIAFTKITRHYQSSTGISSRRRTALRTISSSATSSLTSLWLSGSRN